MPQQRTQNNLEIGRDLRLFEPGGFLKGELGRLVFAAIHGLGLHPAPFKGPVEILVVDHVEKAAEN
jgi:hypothetical protein